MDPVYNELYKPCSGSNKMWSLLCSVSESVLKVVGTWTLTQEVGYEASRQQLPCKLHRCRRVHAHCICPMSAENWASPEALPVMARQVQLMWTQSWESDTMVGAAFISEDTKWPLLPVEGKTDQESSLCRECEGGIIFILWWYVCVSIMRNMKVIVWGWGSGRGEVQVSEVGKWSSSIGGEGHHKVRDTRVKMSKLLCYLVVWVH